jgi:hypothetical protein
MKHIVLAAALGVGVLAAGCAPTGGSAEAERDSGDKPRPPAPPPANAIKLTVMPREVSGPRARIEAAIGNVRSRELTTSNGFWTVFHGILGLGPGVMLTNTDTGQRVNALDYIASGGELRGLRLLPTKYGLDVPWPNGPQGINIPQGVGQGHQDQFACEMGQWGMPADRKFVVYGKEYTFMHFVRHSQMRASVTRHQELSWAAPLIGMYVGLDAAWTTQWGEKLRLEDLVRYEVDASVEQAPCGGTHRLFGLTWLWHMHLQRGGKKEGVWKDVAEKTARYKELARRLQNGDGSFSTNWFQGPGNSPDRSARISTSGHTLEWLALALDDKEIRKDWVENGANAVALMILELQDAPIDGGALYHAVHGLQIYHARVYDPGMEPPELLYPQPRDRPPLSLAPAGKAVKLPPPKP